MADLILRKAAIKAIEELWAFPVREDEGASAIVAEVKRQAIQALNAMPCLKLEASVIKEG